MAQPELDRLVINNLADLDAATKYILDELEPEINDALDTILGDFIRKAEWAGSADWKKKITWLAPNDWRKQGDRGGSDFDCRFVYGERVGSGDEYDYFWLTKLLGIGLQTSGLRWTRNDVNKKQWRNAVGSQQAIIARLRECRFEYEQADASFFLPVRIDQSKLAQAVADESPELALAPYSDALRICVDAKPEFDALLKAVGSLNTPQIAAALGPVPAD